MVVPPSMQPFRVGFPPAVRPLGPCHNCGEIGHLKRTCSKPLGTVSPSTKYPPVTNVECSSGEEGESEVSDEEGVGVVDDWLDMWCNNDRVLGEVVVGVKGRLREKCEFWESTLQASNTIISIIKQGYVLPLTVVPDSFSKANNESAISETKFVDLALQELLLGGCVVACRMKPLIVSPLMVVCSAKRKKRLVINLKYLNQFVQKEKFHYEDVRTLLQVAKQGDWLVTFDLQSGYHHIDIHPDSQTFLGFCWEGKYFKFTVLPFRLALFSLR